MNLGLMAASGLLYFNKNLHEDLGLDDLYSIAAEGKLTLDVVLEMASQAAKDLDGDGTYAFGTDRLGVTANNFSFQLVAYGCGTSLVKKDADDRLYLDADEAWTERITGAINFLQQAPAVSYGSPGGFADFIEGRALFVFHEAYYAPMLRDMENDYGVLPLPKYNEEQEHYTTQFHTSYSSVTAVPVSMDGSDADMIGRILEDMTCQSHFCIRPAFYDTLMRGKLARDEESSGMMDLIFDNIIVDFGYMMSTMNGWDYDAVTRSYADQGNTNIASLLASRSGVWNAVIDEVNASWGSGQ